MAGLLDTFYFMFDADTSKLKKGLTDARQESGKLTDDLNKSDKSTQNLGKSFLELAGSVAKVGAALGALAILKKVTYDTAAHTYEVAQQARALGVSTEALSTWQHAVMASGGTAEGATQTMETLRQKFVEMSRFGAMMGTDAFAFRQMGLSAKDMHDSIKDPTIALQKLSNVFGSLNKTQQLFVGKKLGLDQGTITLLSQGRQAFDDMIAKQKELGVVTEKQADAARKFELAQVSLGITLETVKREVTTALLPALTWMYEKIEKFVQFVRNHKVFVIGFFVAIGVAIASTVLPPLIAAAVAMWALIAPVLAAAAPFIALGLAVGLLADDIDNFLNGSNSMIGELSKKYPMLGRVIKQFAADTKAEFKNLLAAGQFFNDVFTMGLKKAAAKYTGAVGINEHERDEAYRTAGDTGKPLNTDIIAAAKAAEAKYGVPASVTLAQYELESGSGKHMPAGSNNPFGIKAVAGQDYVMAKTTEMVNGQSVQIMAKFAKFASVADAFDAHAKLLATGAAYAAARKHTDDPYAYADALTGKYATDPQYGAKLKALIANGQSQLAIASNSPIASMSSAAISNSSRTSSNNVNIGSVAVNTQATDSDQIAASLGLSLNGHMRNMLDQNDDGLAI